MTELEETLVEPLPVGAVTGTSDETTAHEVTDYSLQGLETLSTDALIKRMIADQWGWAVERVYDETDIEDGDDVEAELRKRELSPEQQAMIRDWFSSIPKHREEYRKRQENWLEIFKARCKESAFKELEDLYLETRDYIDPAWVQTIDEEVEGRFPGQRKAFEETKELLREDWAKWEGRSILHARRYGYWNMIIPYPVGIVLCREAHKRDVRMGKLLATLVMDALG